MRLKLKYAEKFYVGLVFNEGWVFNEYIDGLSQHLASMNFYVFAKTLRKLCTLFCSICAIIILAQLPQIEVQTFSL